MHAGVDLVHVPFRGATAVLPDLVAGRIDMFIGAVNSLLPLIQEGSLRALAATSLTRIPALPDVPTLSESGLPGFEVGSGVGLVAPAATPPDIVDTLNREIAAIIATPGFHQRMAAIGVDVVGTTPAAYAKYHQRRLRQMGQGGGGRRDQAGVSGASARGSNPAASASARRRSPRRPLGPENVRSQKRLGAARRCLGNRT